MSFQLNNKNRRLSNMQRQIQSSNLYEHDFNAWALDEANKLKLKKFDALDIDNLVEEIEDMSIRQKHSLKSRLIVLLAHLLKWQYQPSLRCGSWKGTITTQRIEIESLLDESPSLKNNLLELMKDQKVFKKAFNIVINETGLFEDNLPKNNPFNIEQIMDVSFYPN